MKMQIKPTSWKVITEPVGIRAIVGSLIFVGLQIKQSQEIAIASRYQSRAEATMSLYQTQIKSDYLAPGIANKMEQLSLAESVADRDVANILWAWTAFDNHHYQYQAGLLSGDAWQG
jgi:hypothetical protein